MELMSEGVEDVCVSVTWCAGEKPDRGVGSLGGGERSTDRSDHCRAAPQRGAAAACEGAAACEYDAWQTHCIAGVM